MFKASSQSKARLYLGALWNTDCPSSAKDAKDDCKEHWNSLWLKPPPNVSLGSCLVNAENEISFKGHLMENPCILCRTVGKSRLVQKCVSDKSQKWNLLETYA